MDCTFGIGIGGVDGPRPLSVLILQRYGFDTAKISSINSTQSVELASEELRAAKASYRQAFRAETNTPMLFKGEYLFAIISFQA